MVENHGVVIDLIVRVIHLPIDHVSVTIFAIGSQGCRVAIGEVDFELTKFLRTTIVTKSGWDIINFRVDSGFEKDIKSRAVSDSRV